MEDEKEFRAELTKALDEATAKAGLSYNIGQACIICGGKILRDEDGDYLYSPFYCEDCVEGMRDKEMTPHEYAKKKGVNLPELN